MRSNGGCAGAVRTGSQGAARDARRCSAIPGSELQGGRLSTVKLGWYAATARV